MQATQPAVVHFRFETDNVEDGSQQTSETVQPHDVWNARQSDGVCVSHVKSTGTTNQLHN